MLCEGCSTRCRALCLCEVATQQRNAISDLRLPALSTQNSLGSNPPQAFPPPKNGILVLEKLRTGYRCKGFIQPCSFCGRNCSPNRVFRSNCHRCRPGETRTTHPPCVTSCAPQHSPLDLRGTPSSCLSPLQFT